MAKAYLLKKKVKSNLESRSIAILSALCILGVLVVGSLGSSAESTALVVGNGPQYITVNVTDRGGMPLKSAMVQGFMEGAGPNGATGMTPTIGGAVAYCISRSHLPPS